MYALSGWTNRRTVAPAALSFVLCCAAVACCSAVVGAAGVAGVPPQGESALGTADHDALIGAYLRAGEFGPALELARRAGDRRQADAWLTQIALAQAAVGARHAALRTAGEISDQSQRSYALRQMAQQPLGAGGGAEPDFDSLINLLKTTVRPDTWDDGGGPGTVSPFPTGVWVDAQGLLKPLVMQEAEGRLQQLRSTAAVRGRFDAARRRTSLRMISLPRLERHVQLQLAAGRALDETTQLLAGLQRISYVFAYPEGGDLVVAGPAGDWRIDAENRAVSIDTGLPVVRLDDLVVVLRHVMHSADGKFGCLIVPRAEGLARLQQFLEQSGKRPLQPSERRAWLEQLRTHLGVQDIEVYGLDPRTRPARIMVEADYRMKLVGMGLEESVPGVPSYLSMVRLGPDGKPPAMSVLRWWFTLDYEAVETDADRLAFQFRGQGIKVLSENERLTADGQRIHTGMSDELNRQFARNFTRHFPELARKYPVYAELRNIGDLALLAALLRAEDLPAKCGWQMGLFTDENFFPAPMRPAAKQVESVVNYRLVDGRHIVAGVSGGVSCDPSRWVARDAIRPASSADLSQRRQKAKPAAPPETWWWDCQ